MRLREAVYSFDDPRCDGWTGAVTATELGRKASFYRDGSTEEVHERFDSFSEAHECIMCWASEVAVSGEIPKEEA